MILYPCMNALKVFNFFFWPYEMMCNGIKANGWGQQSHLVRRERLTQVHHRLSSDVPLIDTALLVATGAELESL